MNKKCLFKRFVDSKEDRVWKWYISSKGFLSADWLMVSWLGWWSVKEWCVCNFMKLVYILLSCSLGNETGNVMHTNLGVERRKVREGQAERAKKNKASWWGKKREKRESEMGKEKMLAMSLMLTLEEIGKKGKLNKFRVGLCWQKKDRNSGFASLR